MATSEEEVLLQQIQTSKIKLEQIDKNKRTHNVCVAAVVRSWRALEHVPYDTNKYKEICLEAVKVMGYALELVSKNMDPNSEAYQEICLAAVKKDGDALKFVSKDMDPNSEAYQEICLEAVKKDAYALQFVKMDPNSEIYQQICLAAVKKDASVLEFVSEKMDLNSKTYREICLAAVKQYGYSLKFVSPKSKAYREICLVAVRQDGYALESVKDMDPNSKPYQEISLAAVKQNGSVLKIVTKNMDWDSKAYQEICLAAVKQNGSALDFVSEKMDSNSEAYQEICLAAVKQNGSALEFVFQDMDPNSEAYQEICLAAVKQNGSALEFVDEDMDSEAYQKICLAAVEQNGSALKIVTKNMDWDSKDYQKICLAAVKQNGSALEFVSKNMDPNSEAYQEICLAAVKQNGSALEFVSKYMDTNSEAYQKICLAAVKQDCRTFRSERVLEEFRMQILQHDNIAETMLRNGYDPLPALRTLSPSDKEEVRYFLDELEKNILQSCNTIVVQPQPDDFEAEDLKNIYARKHVPEKTICVRTMDQLEKKLDRLKEFDNIKVNLAIAGHTSIKAESIASLKPPDIASLAKKNPIIKRIILLGCETGASQELLSQEKINAAEFKKYQTDIEERIREQHPMLKDKKASLRLEKLVNDILWQTGESCCGVHMMFESSENKITPETLKEKGLDNSLDSAYVFVKNKDTDSIAVYYLARNIDGINCNLISDKLSPEQIGPLRDMKELTIMTGDKKNKLKLMDSTEQQAEELKEAQAAKAKPRGGKQQVKEPDLSAPSCWCTNNKGEIATLKTEPLDEIAKILHHNRNIHYTDLPPLPGLGDKRSYKRKIVLSVHDKETQDIKSLVMQVVNAIKEEFKDGQPSVDSVKGYRGKLYPDPQEVGLISTSEHVLNQGKYPGRFFSPEQSKEETGSFINAEAAKTDIKDADIKGREKSVEVTDISTINKPKQ